jgi:hypothetical protein
MCELPESEAFQVREFGEDDDAWQTVQANSVFASRRTEKNVTEPNKTIWIDFVRVDLQDGTQRVFNYNDEVEVRSLPSQGR